jgi:hypothetical protein
MLAVRKVQVIADQIVDMVTVRHGLVAARGTVLVSCFVTGAAMGRRASVWICVIHVDAVLVDMIFVRVMQVPVVQVVDVIIVPDGGVTTSLAVLMCMSGMYCVCAGRQIGSPGSFSARGDKTTMAAA